MSKCNKQLIGNIEAKFTKKLSNIETVLKNALLIKERVYVTATLFVNSQP